MSNHKIVILTGPSGVGKSVLVKHLTQHRSIEKCITCTTRAPRYTEIPGIDYHFISETEFFEARDNREFVETNSHYANHYGLRYSDLTDRVARSHVVVLLNWEGALALEKSYSNAATIFIEPPSIEVLQSRLSEREDVSRIQYAKEDMAHAGFFQHRLINDNLVESTQALLAMVDNILMEK